MQYDDRFTFHLRRSAAYSPSLLDVTVLSLLSELRQFGAAALPIFQGHSSVWSVLAGNLSAVSIVLRLRLGQSGNLD